MQSALRPYATTGVAIAGAGLIAITPTMVPLPDTPAAPTARDVALTAGGGFFEPFIEPFNTASDDFAQILQNFGLAPFVGLQQAIVNQAGFLQDVFDDPSNITDVVDQTQENLKTVLTAITGFGMSGDTQSTVFDHTLEGLRSTLVDLLPGFLPDDIDPDMVTTALQLLSSPLSGIMIGMVGPFISPLVALANSIDAGDDPGDILANTIGAFFNGATLDLDSLIPVIEEADILPEDMSFEHLELAFGGLFSTGDVSAGDYGVPIEFDPGDDNDSVDTITVTPVGGSIFNSIGIELGGVPFLNELDLESHAVGPLGAMIGTSQIIGVLLGSGWDDDGGKGDTGNGPAIPPLLHLLAPNLPDDFFDGGDGDSAAAEAVSDMLSGGDTLADTWGNFF